jgi:hypothetical protein
VVKVTHNPEGRQELLLYDLAEAPSSTYTSQNAVPTSTQPVSTPSSHPQSLTQTLTAVATLPHPSLGSVSHPSCGTSSCDIFYRFSNFSEHSSIYRAVIGRHSPDREGYRAIELSFDQVYSSGTKSLDPSLFDTKRVLVPTRRGTIVPIYIFGLKTSFERKNRPCIIHIRQHFNSPVVPYFSLPVVLFVKHFEAFFCVVDLHKESSGEPSGEHSEERFSSKSAGVSNLSTASPALGRDRARVEQDNDDGPLSYTVDDVRTVALYLTGKSMNNQNVLFDERVGEGNRKTAAVAVSVTGAATGIDADTDAGNNNISSGNSSGKDASSGSDSNNDSDQSSSNNDTNTRVRRSSVSPLCVPLGLCSPSQLGLYAGTNGSATAANCINKYPGLFACAVVDCGMFDLMRYQEMDPVPPRHKAQSVTPATATAPNPIPASAPAHTTSTPTQTSSTSATSTSASSSPTATTATTATATTATSLTPAPIPAMTEKEVCTSGVDDSTRLILQASTSSSLILPTDTADNADTAVAASDSVSVSVSVSLTSESATTSKSILPVGPYTTENDTGFSRKSKGRVTFKPSDDTETSVLSLEHNNSSGYAGPDGEEEQMGNLVEDTPFTSPPSSSSSAPSSPYSPSSSTSSSSPPKQLKEDTAISEGLISQKPDPTPHKQSLTLPNPIITDSLSSCYTSALPSPLLDSSHTHFQSDPGPLEELDLPFQLSLKTPRTPGGRSLRYHSARTGLYGSSGSDSGTDDDEGITNDEVLKEINGSQSVESVREGSLRYNATLSPEDPGSMIPASRHSSKNTFSHSKDIRGDVCEDLVEGDRVIVALGESDAVQDDSLSNLLTLRPPTARSAFEEKEEKEEVEEHGVLDDISNSQHPFGDRDSLMTIGFSHSGSSSSSSGNSSSSSSNDNLLMAASLSVPGLTETLDNLPSDPPTGSHEAGQQLLDGHNIEMREDVGSDGGRVGVGGGKGEGSKADLSQQHAWYPVIGPSVSPAGHARLLQCSPLHTLLSAYSPEKIWNCTIPCSEGVGREVVYPAMLLVTRESMM